MFPGSNKLRDVGLNVMSHGYCQRKSSLADSAGGFPVVQSAEFCAGVPDRRRF